jgi:hypothetical protein
MTGRGPGSRPPPSIPEESPRPLLSPHSAEGEGVRLPEADASASPESEAPEETPYTPKDEADDGFAMKTGAL